MREPDFADIRAYLQSLELPRYPFTIDQAAGRGRARRSYERTCCDATAAYGRRAIPIPTS